MLSLFGANMQAQRISNKLNISSTIVSIIVKTNAVICYNYYYYIIIIISSSSSTAFLVLLLTLYFRLAMAPAKALRA